MRNKSEIKDDAMNLGVGAIAIIAAPIWIPFGIVWLIGSWMREWWCGEDAYMERIIERVKKRDKVIDRVMNQKKSKRK